jgi:dTDP-4-amino-4,6-dideoxygalactose transaminase
MLNTKFSPWPSFTDEEAAAVSRVLLSNRVNQWTGTEVRTFEQEFTAWAGTKHAIALANGTLALDLALHGLRIGRANGGNETDEVIVTPRSFIASVSCVVNAGAVPVFADVDRDTGNLCADTIKPHVTKNTKAVIPVHLAGLPCDMDPIMALAHQHGFKVIEDCAQAHGALYKGRSVGSIGHVNAWSFCQDKIMTTGGEGGMVTCDDEAVWSRMWAFKDHGKSYDAVFNREHPPGFRWVHESIGTNWRMLEMQAVIGRIQLSRLDAWRVKRQLIADELRDAVKPFTATSGVARLPRKTCAGCSGCAPSTGCRHANYRFYFHVQPDNLAPGWSRDKIVSELMSLGVPAYQGSCSEIYREKAFESTKWRPLQSLPAARELGETSVMMLTHPTLTPEEIGLSRTALAQVLGAAQRHQG